MYDELGHRASADRVCDIMGDTPQNLDFRISSSIAHITHPNQHTSLIQVRNTGVKWLKPLVNDIYRAVVELDVNKG